MTASTAAALVCCWWGNREGKWKRLLSCRKRSGRHTNEGRTPEKRRLTATAGAARERGDGGDSRRSGQGGRPGEYLLLLLLRGQRWPGRAGRRCHELKLNSKISDFWSSYLAVFSVQYCNKLKNPFWALKPVFIKKGLTSGFHGPLWYPTIQSFSVTHPCQVLSQYKLVWP